MERQTTPSIAGEKSLHKSLPPQREKSRIAIKSTVPWSSINFTLNSLWFGGRKNRKERKNCPKICLFGFPVVLMMGSTTTAARKVVSSSTLIGPFEFEREREGPYLSARSNFKWTNQGWGWNHLANGRCRGPHHKNFRKAEEANFRATFSFFTSLSTAKAHEWNLLSFLELLILLRFGTFPFEEKAICGVTSDQRWMEWSAFPFF